MYVVGKIVRVCEECCMNKDSNDILEQMSQKQPYFVSGDYIKKLVWHPVQHSLLTSQIAKSRMLLNTVLFFLWHFRLLVIS